ncbi:radical SAM protein, partial [Caldisericum sp.]|uniref:radical SAM protein n=1 Tax=Caldisericum sp. TaxID=2499687 RepID=UPI003D0A2918
QRLKKLLVEKELEIELLEECVKKRLSFYRSIKKEKHKKRFNVGLTEVGIREESAVPMKHARILRGPYQMSFDITNKCNFRCLHCYNRSGENPVIERELTDEEVLEFANDLARLKLFNFCFCGGEPFLRFELMCEVGKILSSSGSIVSFVTNGSLVTEEKAKKLLASGVT